VFLKKKKFKASQNRGADSPLSPEETKQALKNKAIYLLARREHARQELHRKLLQKGFTANVIHEVLDELENENLLNEERYITSFIRSRRSKGFGPLKICAELREHGIDRHRWQSNEEWQEELWQNSAILLCAKRFGFDTEKNREQRMRQTRYLEQRGFTSQQIKIALNTQSWDNDPE
jgi:regulatory protein